MTTTFTARPCIDVRADHGEGVTWDARSNQLLWVDLGVGLVHLGDYDGTALQIARTYSIGVDTGTVVPVSNREGGWMLGRGEGFAYLAEDGSVTGVAEPEAAKGGTTRMNDGKCDPVGRFWAGSMAYDKRTGGGSFYTLDLDLSVRCVFPNVSISNGLCWPAEGNVMYYIDTPTQRVDAMDYDAEAGTVSNRRPAVHIDKSWGSPDGMTIDDEGCLWVAIWDGHAVGRFSPDGELLARVDVDAKQVSCCGFGGDGMRTLFITTSQEGMSEQERAADPQAGKVFVVDDAGVSGPAALPFRGDLPSR